MNRFLFLLGTALLLGGCAGPSRTPERDWQRYYADRAPSSALTHGCVAKVGPECRARILWHCPPGFVDGCYTPGSTGRHECVTRGSSSGCEVSVAMVCPQGFEDGCENGSSASHECVAKAGGPSCAESFALVCPAGFQDACLSSPEE
jgi:hypothetical protein